MPGNLYNSLESERGGSVHSTTYGGTTNTGDNRPSTTTTTDGQPDLAADGSVEILLRPKGPLTVEPTLAMFFMVNIPSQVLTSQFLYAVVSGRNNLTEMISETGLLINGTLTCTGDSNSSLYALQQYVQSQAATWMLSLNLAFSLPAISMVLVYGSYSDRIGRKVPLILPQVGHITKCIIFVVVLHYRLSLGLLFIAMIIEGATGSLPTMMMSCMAYLADVHDPARRTFRITTIEVCSGISAAAATVAMGYLILHMGYIYPFLFLIGVNGINLIYTIYFVPEVRRDRNRNMVTTRMLLRTVQLLKKPDLNGKRWPRIVLLLALMYVDTVVVGRWDTITLYELNSPLCWNSVLIGINSAYSGISSFLGGLAVVWVAHNRIGDIGVAVVGCLSGISYCSGLTVATETWIVFTLPVVGFCMNVPSTMIRVMTSKMTSASDQGSLFALLCAAESVCNMAGDLVFNPIYSATLNFMKGFVFIVMALFIFVGLVHIVIYGLCREQSPQVWSTSNVDYEGIASDGEEEAIVDRDRYQDAPERHSCQPITL